MMGGDELAGVRIVNLRDLPTETRTNRKQQKREDQALLVTFQECSESSHTEKRHGSKSSHRAQPLIEQSDEINHVSLKRSDLSSRPLPASMLNTIVGIAASGACPG